MQETKEEISNIKINMAELKTDLKNIKEQNSKEHQDIMNCLGEINDKFDELPDKFAGKWVEKVLWSIGAVLGTAILYAFIRVILKIDV
jgi:hypothetical protein